MNTRLTLALLSSTALALAPIAAMAAGGPPAPIVGPVSPTGPLSSTPPAKISVVDYGAKCDAVLNINTGVVTSGTDDLTPINAAIAQWKLALVKGPATLVFPRNGKACKVSAPVNMVSIGGQGAVVDGMNVAGSFSSNGAVGTLGTITAGTGGANATYSNVSLTGGSGTGCIATSVVVSGGGVTSIVLASPGCGASYALADTLSAASGDIGGVTGFSVPVASISGRAVVDAMGSLGIDFVDASIYGDCTSAATTPNVGIAIGRKGNGVSADVFAFGALRIKGCFALANMYNLASETNSFYAPQFWNYQTIGVTYAAVMDGLNYWNWSSPYVAMTTPLDTGQSFNENTFYSMDFRTNYNVAGRGIWMTETTRHKYRGYIATSTYGSVLYSEANGSVNRDLDFDVHIETASVTDCFFLTGTNTAPILYNLIYRDHSSLCSNSIFKTDTNVTSAFAYGLDVQVTSVANGGVHLFDNASLWSGGGHVYLPSSAAWTAPASWTGDVCITATCTNIVPTAALNRNPDFVIDQKSEGASVTSGAANRMIVDGWHLTQATGVSNQIAFQRLATLSPPGYTYAERATTQNVDVSPVAGAVNAMRSTIEGPNTNILRWGTAAAIPATFDFCALANNAGTYTTFVQNQAQTQSFLYNFTLAANTWKCFTESIPAITSGAWTVGRNNIGVWFGFTMFAGSNFVGTDSTWNSGAFYSTASTFNLSATVGNTLAVAAVHFRPGQFDQPYLPRPVSEELQLSQHWYRKSFNVGVAAAQNAGAAGATTIYAPYAFATSTLVGTQVNFPPMYDNNGNTLPTITFYSTTAASANCYNSTQAADAGAATAVNQSDSGFFAQCALIAGDLLGDQVRVHWDADSFQ